MLRRVLMKKILNNVRAMSFMIPILLMNSIIYGMLDVYTNTNRNLVTSLDRSTPFVKQFIIPYVMWYIMVPLVFLYVCSKDKRTYCRMIISMAIGLIISYITFFFFQTTVPRPQLVGHDICTDIIRLVYSADRPINCFPSIHVMNCFLMIEGIWVTKNRSMKIAIATTVMSVLIILSTLFIKQHVIMDGVFGIIIASVTFAAANIFVRNEAIDFCKRVYMLTDIRGKTDVKY
jgi:membrane-associated phospholipid phosphatase